MRFKEVCFLLFSSDQHHLVLHVGGLPLSEGAEWAAWIAKRGQSGKQVGDDLNMMIMMIMLHDDYDDLLFYMKICLRREAARLVAKYGELYSQARSDLCLTFCSKTFFTKS